MGPSISSRTLSLRIVMTGSGTGGHQQRGRDRRHALAAPGQPEPVGGGAGHRHRAAHRGGQHPCASARRVPIRGVADHLDRRVADVQPA